VFLIFVTASIHSLAICIACILFAIVVSNLTDFEYILYIHVIHIVITNITIIASAIDVAFFNFFIDKFLFNEFILNIFFKIKSFCYDKRIFSAFFNC
jgi:hypothetical protein